jgi:hypothetical protein
MLFAISFAAFAEAEQGIPGPPLSQSLVREGTLAMNLAHAFRLGSPTSEPEAESALTAAGIVPRNGWIADYPATPDVVIELRNAVSSAADAKRLALNKGEALQIFDNVTKDYELPIQAANTGPAVSPVTPPMPVRPDPVVINNYYTQEGPPVVTYYAPPVDYSYLYSYVPYPFWWADAWFPGYYMLRDFSLLALGYGAWYHGYWPGYGYGYWGGYGRYGYWGGYGYGYWWGGNDHYYGHHDGHNDGHHGDGHNGHGGQGGHGGDRHVVSNHYRNHDTGTTHRIDPANRAHSGNNRQSANSRTAYNSSNNRGATSQRNYNTDQARYSGNNRQSANNRTAYNGSNNRGATSQRNYNTDQARYSGNNRQSANNRTAYNGSYNRGSNGNTGRVSTASARSYSANSSYRQPAQRASYQTRQNSYSAVRGRAYNASYSAGRGQSGGSRSFSGNGRGGSFSGGSGRSSGSGRATGGRRT